VILASGPLDMRWIRTRLRERVPALRDVRGAASYAGLVRGIQDFTPDEAFVIPLKELPPEQSGQTGGRQVARSLFGVVIATRLYADEHGEAALDSVGTVIGAVRDALVGWTPTSPTGDRLSGARPCSWMGGEMLDYSVETLLWSEVFATQHNIGSATP